VPGREEIVQALFDRLKNSGAYAEATRRNRAPESVKADHSPMLALLERQEFFERPSPSLPPKRIMILHAMISVDVGDDVNAVPAAIVNDLLDALEAALAPDDPITGKCTLGRLAESVMIDGEIVKAPLDAEGKTQALVPIRVLIP
jgi:hypothetical protein